MVCLCEWLDEWDCAVVDECLVWSSTAPTCGPKIDTAEDTGSTMCCVAACARGLYATITTELPGLVECNDKASVVSSEN